MPSPTPYLGIKAVDMSRAPMPSQASTVPTMPMSILLMFAMEPKLMDSCASCISRRPSFLPAMTVKKVEKVTRPRPPTWISRIMTICPNRLQCVKVS